MILPCINYLTRKMKGLESDLEIYFHPQQNILHILRGHKSCSLSLPPQLQAVPLQPVGAPASTLGLVELVSLAKAARALAGGSQSTQLPVLLHGGAHPVDLGVTGDRGVVDVDHDHLVVPEGGD